MTREHAKNLLPVIQAWAEGKEIQHLDGSHTWRNATAFDFSDSSNRYRIKPTPTLRPWRPEEVPVGALIKFETDRIYLILARINDEFLMASDDRQSINSYSIAMFKDKQYSIDNGKTWLPCGVVE